MIASSSLLVNIVFIFVLKLRHVILTQPEKPIITSVTKLTENSVELRWLVPPLNTNLKYILTRYRVQMSVDNFTFDIREWPSQYNEIASDTNGQLLNITTTKSNFDCFNECIRNALCSSVTCLSHKKFNCYLKSKFDLYRFPPVDAQVIQITDYKDKAILANLPYNSVYRFRVMVYDLYSNKWSEFSDPSLTEIDVKINLQLNVYRVDFTTLKLIWKQVGNYTNYVISRLNVQTSINEEPFVDNFQHENLTKINNMEPSYIESTLTPAVGLMYTEQECFAKCLEYSSCVKYVFFNNGSCHLMSSYNPTNGILDSSCFSKSIKSISNEFLLKDLKLFSNYKIKIDYKTPYGISGTSNLVSYILTNLKPLLKINADTSNFTVSLNWTIIEKLDFRTYSVYFSVNESIYFSEYFETDRYDYDDPTAESLKTNLSDCLAKCIGNKNCKTFTWNEITLNCWLKFDKSVKKICNSSTICISLPEYKNSVSIKNHFVNTNYCYMVSVWTYFGHSGEKSNQACFKWNVTLTIQSETNEFVENESTTLRCDLYGMESNKAVEIKWFKDNVEIDSRSLENKNSAIKVDDYKPLMKYNFFNLSHVSNDGKYHCALKLKNTQYIYSNQLDLKTKYGPIIKLNTKENILMVNESDSISFSCTAEGYPIPNIKWLFKNSDVNDQDGFSFYNAFSKEAWISLKNATKAMNGTYTCYLSDQIKYSIDLIVMYGPILTYDSKDITIGENETVQLSCTVESNPIIQPVWINLSNQKIMESEKLNNLNKQTAVLTFNKVTRHDAGSYLCHVDNKEQKDNAISAIFELFVLYPSFLNEQKSETSIYARVNDTIEMSCSFGGYPLPSTEWRAINSNSLLKATRTEKINNKMTITSSNTTSLLKTYLTLTNVNKMDRGNYTCAVENDDDHSKMKTFSLIIQNKPSRPTVVEASSILNHQKLTKINLFSDDYGDSPLDKVFVEWSSTSDFENASSIKNYTLIYNQPIKFEDGTNFEIELNISMSTSDTEISYLRVALENSIDISEFSKPVKVTISNGNNVNNNKIQGNNVLFQNQTLNKISLITIGTFVALGVLISCLILIKKLKDYLQNKKLIYKENSLKLNSEASAAAASTNQINQSFNSLSRFKNFKLINKKFKFKRKMLNRKKHASSIIDQSGTTNNTSSNFSECVSMSRLGNMSENLTNASNTSLVISGSRDGCSNFSKDKSLAFKKTKSSKKCDSKGELLTNKTAQIGEYAYSKEALMKKLIDDFDSLDRDMHFEFCEIRNPNNKTFDDSLKIQNERKSRYKHVYPYDDNRVKLNQIPERPDSDFINASYIEGFNQPKQFIAAQGPTKETCYDFLRMICEKEIKTIVMLTQLYEGDPPCLKCWPYWNDDTLLKFNLITIEVKSVRDNNFYETRLLELKYLNETFLVDHYYYKEWPDRLCPSESQSIIELISKLPLADHDLDEDETTEDLKSNVSPILVHCSAGIGRTGTFIGIVNLIEMMRLTNHVNPKEVVSEMRKQRAFLVQNWEQYKYIHQTVLEWCLFCSSNESTLVSVNDRGLCHSLLNDHDHLNRIEIEYQNLIKIRDRFRFKTYTFENLIKKDSNLFEITEEVNGSHNLDDPSLKDFILIKNPPLRVDFLITSEPTSKTVNDYLSVILKHKPIAIVSLCSSESACLTQPTFQSSNGIMVISNQISLETDIFSFKVYQLELKDTKNKNYTFMTKLYTSVNMWDNQSEQETKSSQLPNSKLNYIKLIDSFLRHVISNKNASQPSYSQMYQNKQIFNSSSLQSNSSNSMAAGSSFKIKLSPPPVVLIQTKDAKTYDRCGIYLALVYSLLSIRKTRHFDIVQSVRLLRKCYNKLINKYEHYKYIYEICCSNELFNLMQRDHVD